MSFLGYKLHSVLSPVLGVLSPVLGSVLSSVLRSVLGVLSPVLGSVLSVLRSVLSSAPTGERVVLITQP